MSISLETKFTDFISIYIDKIESFDFIDIDIFYIDTDGVCIDIDMVYNFFSPHTFTKCCCTEITY